MQLSSSKFVHEGKIPPLYTCDGKNINPPLQIRGVPHAARSLVLLLEDPDVPAYVRADCMWDHWVLYNLPPTIQEIAEGATPSGLVGLATSGASGYEGPCPPDREHRYVFTLYALDQMLPLQEGATKKEVLAAMENHVLASTVLIGLYERQHG